MKLYEVAAVVERLLDEGIDDETGEMSGELVAALNTLQEGGRAVVAYSLNCRAQAEAVGAAIKRLQARKRALENKDERLRAYLREQMARTGVTRIDAVDATWSARLERDRDESVVVPEGTVLPDRLCRIKIEPDKAKIKQAILAGEPVPEGVQIVRKDRLTIS
jgi:rhamnose utilization protein RhaD (predicted bifunctional aldolase and dehydrogenase)